MLIPDAAYDSHTVAIMGLACDQAWEQFRSQCSSPSQSSSDTEAVRNTIAKAVIAAVVQGERDPDRLTAHALHAIDGDKFPAPSMPAGK
jgi:hypothetical protein